MCTSLAREPSHIIGSTRMNGWLVGWGAAERGGSAIQFNLIQSPPNQSPPIQTNPDHDLTHARQTRLLMPSLTLMDAEGRRTSTSTSTRLMDSSACEKKHPGVL